MLIDVRHLSRSLLRSPASAGAAVVTLSLTLGVGASIFAVVRTVLLTPPPFSNPDALVIVGETPIDAPAAPPRSVTYATFEAWRERAGSLAAMEAGDGTNLTLTELGAAERVSAQDVTTGYLGLLGVKPVIGRGFERDDVARPVAILSDAFWRAKLAADPAVVGRSIVLGGQPHTIVAVLPEHFVFDLNPSEVWRPIPVTPAHAAGAGYRVSVIARLAPHVSPASLAAALDDVSRRSSPPARVVVIPVVAAITGDAAKTIGLLAGAAAVAVLIAFANFGGLLLVRSIDRRREFAIRSALGARPTETARQLLLEAQALVALGTLSGVLLALWITPVVSRLALEQFDHVKHRNVTVSWEVLAVVAIAASVCGACCALLPARMARRNGLDVLHRGVTATPRELVLRRAVVTGEVALAFVLLTCVTLLGESLYQLLGANPGFDPRGVLALQVSVPATGYDSDRVASFYATLQSALEDRLGHRSSGIINELPLTSDRGRVVVSVRSSEVGREAVVREASPTYFDVMRIPIVAGRTFTPREDASAPQRVLISQSLAETLFVSEEPIGRHIWISGAQRAEVVGVVGDVKHRALDETSLPTVYLSALQSPSRSSIVVVRSALPEADVIAAVRDEVRRLDSNLPVYRVRSMHDVLASSPGMPARRVLTATFIGFGLLALLLSAIGLFGVVAHHVASRRSELALRIALGADPLRILTATLRQGAVMVGSGLIVGSVLSMWAVRVLSAAGFAASDFDAWSLGVPSTMLIIVGAAVVVPLARRAARTNPLAALRSE